MSTLKVNSIIPVSGVPTGGGGGIIQIKQAVKTDTTSTTSSTQADISGLTPTITPTSSSSKVLIMMDIKIGASSNGSDIGLVLNRTIGGSSTEIYIGDSDGSRRRACYASEDLFGTNGDHQIQPIQACFLDSPSTTSEITYSIKWNINGSDVIYVNRDGDDGNDGNSPRLASSLTVMEVSA